MPRLSLDSSKNAIIRHRGLYRCGRGAVSTNCPWFCEKWIKLFSAKQSVKDKKPEARKPSTSCEKWYPNPRPHLRNLWRFWCFRYGFGGKDHHRHQSHSILQNVTICRTPTAPHGVAVSHPVLASVTPASQMLFFILCCPSVKKYNLPNPSNFPLFSNIGDSCPSILFLEIRLNLELFLDFRGYHMFETFLLVPWIPGSKVENIGFILFNLGLKPPPLETTAMTSHSEWQQHVEEA